LKPPPVPETPTVTRTWRFSFWYSSATASEIGKTVDEPSMRTTPGAPAPVRSSEAARSTESQPMSDVAAMMPSERRAVASKQARYPALFEAKT
jgi:hypothetical protein